MESVITQTVEVSTIVEQPVVSKVKPTSKKKKAKKVYETVRVMNCDRCGQHTVHTLFNYETKAYKCNICGSIHTKRN